MTHEHLSSILIVIAIVLPLASWKYFRRPGIPYRSFCTIFFLHKHLYPAGVALHWLGLIFAIAGLTLRWTLA